jgi:predicted HicB family RNase H-like nuclease
MRKRDDQITVRIAGALRAHLEQEARARGKSVSWLVRRVLIEHTAERVAGAEPQQQAA